MSRPAEQGQGSLVCCSLKTKLYIILIADYVTLKSVPPLTYNQIANIFIIHRYFDCAEGKADKTKERQIATGIDILCFFNWTERKLKESLDLHFLLKRRVRGSIICFFFLKKISIGECFRPNLLSGLEASCVRTQVLQVCKIPPSKKKKKIQKRMCYI